MTLLENMSDQFSYVQDNVMQIIQISGQLIIVRAASYDIFLGSQKLLEEANQLLTGVHHENADKRIISPLTGYLLGGFSIFVADVAFLSTIFGYQRKT